MLYMVACDFPYPDKVADWNHWYSGQKLSELLSIPGFMACQRFQAVTPNRSPFLAIHSIEDSEVFLRRNYKNTGGGTFGGWDDMVTEWSRRIFEGVAESPDVPEGSYLAFIDGDRSGLELSGLELIEVTAAKWSEELRAQKAVALDESVQKRAMAVIDEATKDRLAALGDERIEIFRPLTKKHKTPPQSLS